METIQKRTGVAVIVGRPNAGKSTLLNSLIGTKVSITSPKPQTTRFTIEAVFDDDRGQILFLDTPGVFGKAEDSLSRIINKRVEETLKQKINVVIYVVDHTRHRDTEENKIFGYVRAMQCPKILVYNKSDVKIPSHKAQYAFMEEEMDEVLEVSAVKRKNLNNVIEAIFRYMPIGEPTMDTVDLIHRAINIDSKLFISELIREKAFLNLRNEVPYSVTAKVDEILERGNGTKYIKARLITNQERYKPMLVGARGRMIREISMAVRKELETATGDHVYLELTVEVDPHWVEFE